MISFGKNQITLAITLFVLLVVSLFINLGVSPLYLEEPRRAFVALEMLFNKNLFVPTEYGALYFEKPPFWNWMLLLSFKLFGGPTEFAARFYSTLSFVLMGIIMFFSARKYIDLKTAAFSTFFFLISVDIYFHFSQLAEIDLFYSLVTFAAILAVFVFHKQKKYWLLFFTFYLFNAIGFLTKAFPSAVFVVITLLVFFWYKRELKQLIGLPHLAGIILFLMIVGGYFYLYNQTNDALTFIKELWGSSSKRTLTEDHQFLKLIGHIVIFPLETIKNLLPASILIFFVWNKNSLKLIKSNPFVEFSFYMVAGNIIVYWLSPGANQRYIYMLYPFIIILLTFLYINLKKEMKIAGKVFDWFMYVVFGLFILGSIALSFIKELKIVPNLIILSICFGLAFLVLLYFFQRKKQMRVLLFIGAFILFRFLLDFTLVPFRAIDSWPQQNKEDAIAITEIVKDEPVYMYRERISRTTVFYMERETQKILMFKNEFNGKDFFIVPESFLAETNPTVYYKFRNKQNSQLFYLIKL